MFLLKHHPWNTTPEFVEEDSIDWNLWSKKDPPYGTLTEGQSVYLVSGGGPARGRITWEVVATRVLASRYSSKEDAWRQVRSHFAAELKTLPVDRRWFLGNDYTQAAPDEGYLLVWTYAPVRAINLPRPASLRIRGNGWAELETLEFGSGAPIGPRSDGQGRLADPVLRKLVENHAMDRARAWLIARGYAASTLKNTSATEPYDWAVVRRGAEVLRVEVKGLTGDLGSVIVTRNEVDATGDGVPTVLFVSYGIEVERDGLRWNVRNGRDHVVEPWLPAPSDLTVIDYRYDPRGR